MTISTSAPPALGTIIRITVVAGGRRLDVGAPASVPVAELVPEFARELGRLEPDTVHAGYRLLRADGSALDDDRSLQAQVVEDGAVLSLDAGADRPTVRLYDDVVEAVADVVERRYAPWTSQDSARTAVGAALALLVATALALFLDRSDGLVPAVMAGAGAVLLLVAAAVVSRSGRDDISAVGLVLAACAFAAVGGAAATTQVPFWGLPAAFAGVGVVVAAGLGTVAVGRDRVLLVAPVGVGAVMAVLGAVVHVFSFDVGAVYAVGLAVVVVLGNAVPWVATSSARLQVVSPRSDAEIYADLPPVDGPTVTEQMRRGHRALTGLAAAVGLISWFATVPVVATGVVGTVLVVVADGLIMVRARQNRTRAMVATAMTAGVVGLVGTAVAAAVLHPDWRGALAVALAVVAAAVLAVAVISPRPRVRLGRAADAVELAGAVALLPLAVVATGVIGAIRG